MIRWNFPGNQDGQVKGVADAGIENFNGSELSSLARETCQNSLDAPADEDHPEVIVEFERHLVHSDQIPGIDEYRGIIRSCQQFWDRSKSEKAKSFLREAVKQVDRESSFMLRISDYNTTGLSDPYSSLDDPFNFDGWNALVKIDGGANKGDDKAGAFGIGKSAPFSNSYYRLVFYRTYNQALEHAAQGVSRLMSYQVSHQMTSGIGYYGDPDRNRPVESIPELDRIHKRTQIGTDVFVYGFKSDGDWETEIVVELLDSFLMSFYHGMLCVTVQKKKINSETLAGIITRVHEEKPGPMKGAYGNFLALTRTEAEGVHTYSMDFHGLGTIELRILVDPNEKLDRKVLVVRKAGMKLFRLGNISKLVPFTGIMELKGKALNKYFREMETVAHDNWEPGRHSNPRQAKAYYDEIKDWIREIVAKLAEYTSTDEIDVEGLGSILQQEPETVDVGDSDNKRENLNNHLGNIEIMERPTKMPAKGFFYGKGDTGSSESNTTKGTLGKTGDPGLRLLKGKRQRKKLESHRGTPNPEGKDVVVQKKPGGDTNCPLKNVRVIKTGTGNYSVNFEIPHDVDHGRIELVTVGENGKSNRLRINGASAVSGCAAVSMNGDFIETTTLQSSGKIKINVVLADAHDYAMEVNVYEHN